MALCRRSEGVGVGVWDPPFSLPPKSERDDYGTGSGPKKKNQYKMEDPPPTIQYSTDIGRKPLRQKKNYKRIDLTEIHKKNQSNNFLKLIWQRFIRRTPRRLGQRRGSCVFEYGKGMSKRDNEGPGPRLLKQLLYVGRWAVHWMGEGRIKLWMSEYLVQPTGIKILLFDKPLDCEVGEQGR